MTYEELLAQRTAQHEQKYARRMEQKAESYKRGEGYNPDKAKLHRVKYATNYAHHAALRRATLLQATPPWANLEAIKAIYNFCPPNYHVDHMIPLNHPRVCGLHCEDNLQHLPASENILKSNSLLEN